MGNKEDHQLGVAIVILALAFGMIIAWMVWIAKN